MKAIEERYDTLKEMVSGTEYDVIIKENISHPVVAIVVPVYVKAENAIPECVAARPSLLLSEEFRAKAYTQLDELRYEVNKPLINSLLKIESRVAMPRQMPENIEQFNTKIDALFAKHAAKVRRVLARY